MKIIDPRDVSIHNLPRIGLSCNLHSFYGFGIRRFSKGLYDHAFMQYDPDYFASQNALFHSVPVEDYMKPYIKMKFFGFDNINSGQRQVMMEAIKRDLGKPWYKRTYDAVGILGHILHMPDTLQLPISNYCTEADVKYIRMVGHNIPSHPSVKRLNRWLIDRPDDFSKDGYYFKD